jgi:hypothetical protein
MVQSMVQKPLLWIKVGAHAVRNRMKAAKVNVSISQGT